MSQTPMKRAVKSCPMCGKPRSETHAPFCSSACKDRDLVQWLQGGYAIPGEPAHVPTGEEDEDY
ncbi:DNA gyrase inhibitor YacG [Croceicoccus mobilis]|uniref:DNA gyrase inhibitor YacG n=1 Tax=Croceicoccus mobilis TaxID=1703339 RepID=A0A916YZZ5_9SPHN|nr:DNA gyrase inhibitor YacG [Croceicoccus mobilis]GGD69382.1 hypothetical protein GCM10010990_18630 [Croceicoccus mobilis]